MEYIRKPEYIRRKNFILAGKKREAMYAEFNNHGLDLGSIPPPNCLPMTHCCNTKIPGAPEMVFPEELYGGKRNIRFHNKCEELGLHYGVITAVYGMGISWERSKSYHIPTRQRPEEELWQAGEWMAERCAEWGIEHIHYVASPPSVMVTPIISLFASGIPFTVNTNLTSLEGIIQEF